MQNNVSSGSAGLTGLPSPEPTGALLAEVLLAHAAAVKRVVDPSSQEYKELMIHCSYCGKQHNEDAARCRECGTVLVQEFDGWEPLVDSEASEWILRSFAWALEQFGSDVFYEHTVLVTPTRDFLPEQTGDIDERAKALFETVRRLAGMECWPCKLLAQEPDLNPVVDPVTVIENAPRSAAGTFCVSEQEEPEVVITYNSELFSRPQALVATLAHELAHYLGQAAACPPPGGEKNWEYATDLLAVFTGFGLFLANSAVDFRQFTGFGNQGWSSRTLGYLSEFELVYCLAVFCTLKRIERERPVSHLKRPLIPVYDDCLKDLQRKTDVLSELSQIRTTARRNDGS